MLLGHKTTTNSCLLLLLWEAALILTVTVETAKPPLQRGGDRWEIVDWWKNGQISQRSFKERPAITQRSSRSLNDRPVIFTVTMVSAKRCLSPKQSLNDYHEKRSLNECSTSAQRMLKECWRSAQRSLSMNANFFPPWSADGWEINKRTRISHRDGFCVAFERSLRDRVYFWPLNGRPTISVLCKGPLR